MLAKIATVSITLLTCMGRLAGKPVTRTGTGVLDSTVDIIMPMFSGSPATRTAGRAVSKIRCAVCPTGGSNR